jgi:hypothetical protein
MKGEEVFYTLEKAHKTFIKGYLLLLRPDQFPTGGKTKIMPNL